MKTISKVKYIEQRVNQATPDWLYLKNTEQFQDYAMLSARDIRFLIQHFQDQNQTIRMLRAGIKECLSKDWSFGNHGPLDVPQILSGALKASYK